MTTTGMALGMVGVLVAALPGGGEAPADIAARLSRPDGEGWSRQERDEALLALNGHYVGVKDEVLRFLGQAKAESESGVAYGSPLHCALQTAGFWRIAAAEGDLVDRCDLRLIPSTVPRGRDMGLSAFYPAARALAALPVKPYALIARMTAKNHPVLTWVLAETQGREAAVVLLKDRLESGRCDTAVLKAALERLQSVAHDEDLLPRIDMKGDGK